MKKEARPHIAPSPYCTYDGNNLRQSKTVNGATTTHVYDGAEIVADISGEGQTVYARGVNGILFSETNGNRVLYVSNIRGDVSMLRSENQTTLKTYLYDAFGNQRTTAAEDNNPFRYCGEYLDLCSGLIYLRNRYYDPSIGRFITEDPIQDGMNWYAYCGNNPVRFVDPLGLASQKFSMPDQYDYQFEEYLPLRYYAEQWGADVNYNSRTQTATVQFPNQGTFSFTVNTEGTYINNNGKMMVKSSVFKDKAGISQVYSKQIHDKTLITVSFDKGENVNLVWNGFTIGNIMLAGQIRNMSTVPVDDFDVKYYNRLGDSGQSVSMAAEETIGQVNSFWSNAYGIITQFHDPFAGVGFDVHSADTKLRINDQSILYYYVNVFLAAKGNSISFVGHTYGGY